MTEALAAPPAAEQDTSGVADKILRQRLNSLAQELLRSAVPISVTNALLTYLIGRHGAWWLAAVWLITIEATQVWRRRIARATLRTAPDDAARTMALFVRASAAIGWARAIGVGLVWATGDALAWNLTAVIVMGLAAGAVATAGGDDRVMRAWSVPAMGSLAVGWAAAFDWEGLLLAALTVYMAKVLIDYVTLLGDQGRQLILNAEELALERDRVRAANQALESTTVDLRAERDRAAAADAAKTRVLASVSHDLRQPLFAISLNTSALSDIAARVSDPYLGRVEEGLRRGLSQCQSLLDQLVDFSRLEAGAVDVRFAAVDLRELLVAMAPPFQAAAGERGLGWQLDVGSEPIIVTTDPVLFERLLGNLVQNAIKFTERGQISLRARSADRVAHATVELCDSGPGIAPTEHAKVFEEFYQVDNPQRDRRRGVGLGLSIVRRLGNLLAVRLTLDSDLGRGCRFLLELPAAPRNDQASPVPTPQPARIASDGHVLTVLVIDDERDLLDDLSTMLTLKGWAVSTACSSQEACAVIAAGTVPDIVIADFRLAGNATGVEAIRAVHRAASRALPALIITGDTAPHRIVEAEASGFPVLHKPLEGHAVERAMRQAIADADGFQS